MNIEEVRDYCLSFKGVTESMPFDNTTLVFKVMHKMFLLLPLDGIKRSISVKCNPEKALALREDYEAVQPAYHFNKKHWNSIDLESDMSDQLIREWIQHSYAMVVKGLTREQQKQLSDY
ncbi:MAG TPA: MmcQ-like protein [Porphyromonadaceae bacterium]|nr:MmcQ-like protein [Porphyromonadaceae bacterium]